ncbi:Urocanate hydratase, partial [Araneus ventricosus]
ADVGARQEGGRVVFRYPSYVQHIMGDIFSLGFGPFRWVCTSNSQEDLQRTDHMAASVLEDILEEGGKQKVFNENQSILIKGNDCVRVCVRCPDESIPLTAMNFGTEVDVMVT